jgi:hypothetical protein
MAHQEGRQEIDSSKLVLVVEVSCIPLHKGEAIVIPTAYGISRGTFICWASNINANTLRPVIDLREFVRLVAGNLVADSPECSVS